MTGIGVFSGNDCEVLEFAGDLSREIPIYREFGMRVTVSDGTVIQFKYKKGCWKAFLMHRGDLMHSIDNNNKTDYVFFTRGIRWAFATANFYAILESEYDDAIKRKVRGEFVSKKEKEIIDGQNNKRTD